MLSYKDYRQKFNETTENADAARISAEIDKAVDAWVSSLKQVLINPNTPPSMRRNWWDRFKNTLSNLWYGRYSEKNPYLWKNKLGDDLSYSSPPNESFNPIPLSLNDYRELKEIVDEMESVLIESDGAENLRLVKILDQKAKELKDALKKILLLAAPIVSPTPTVASPEVQTVAPSVVSTPFSKAPIKRGTKAKSTISPQNLQPEPETKPETNLKQQILHIDNKIQELEILASSWLDLPEHEQEKFNKEGKKNDLEKQKLDNVPEIYQRYIGPKIPKFIKNSDPRHKILLFIIQNNDVQEKIIRTEKGRKSRWLQDTINSGKIEGIEGRIRSKKSPKVSQETQPQDDTQTQAQNQNNQNQNNQNQNNNIETRSGLTSDDIYDDEALETIIGNNNIDQQTDDEFDYDPLDRNDDEDDEEEQDDENPTDKQTDAVTLLRNLKLNQDAEEIQIANDLNLHEKLKRKIENKLGNIASELMSKANPENSNLLEKIAKMHALITPPVNSGKINDWEDFISIFSTLQKLKNESNQKSEYAFSPNDVKNFYLQKLREGNLYEKQKFLKGSNFDQKLEHFKSLLKNR